MISDRVVYLLHGVLLVKELCARICPDSKGSDWVFLEDEMAVKAGAPYVVDIPMTTIWPENHDLSKIDGLLNLRKDGAH